MTGLPVRKSHCCGKSDLPARNGSRPRIPRSPRRLLLNPRKRRGRRTSERSPRPVPECRSILARGPGRRLGSARLRTKERTCQRSAYGHGGFTPISGEATLMALTMRPIGLLPIAARTRSTSSSTTMRSGSAGSERSAPNAAPPKRSGRPLARANSSGSPPCYRIRWDSLEIGEPAVG